MPMAGHERLSVVSLSHLDSPSKWDEFAQNLSRKLLSPAAGTIVVDYRPFGDGCEGMATSVVTTSISSNHDPHSAGNHGRSSSKKLRAACLRVLETLVHGLVPTHHQSNRPKECPTYQQLPASYSTAAVARPREKASFDEDFTFPLRRCSSTRAGPKKARPILKLETTHDRHDSGVVMEEADRPDSPTLAKKADTSDPTDDDSSFGDTCSICSSIESLEGDFEKQYRDSGFDMGEKVLVAQVVQIRRAARKSIYPQRTPSMPNRAPPQPPPEGFF